MKQDEEPSSAWKVPRELRPLVPWARRLEHEYGMNEIEAVIASLTPADVDRLAAAHADFRTRRLIHVYNRWDQSADSLDPEGTGLRPFLRLLIVFDLLRERGVRPFRRYRRPLVWKTTRPRRAKSLKLPREFGYLTGAMRRFAVIGTEEQQVDHGATIRGKPRATLLALKGRAFKDPKLAAWLAKPAPRGFAAQHQLLSALMMMLDHMHEGE